MRDIIQVSGSENQLLQLCIYFFYFLCFQFYMQCKFTPKKRKTELTDGLIKRKVSSVFIENFMRATSVSNGRMTVLISYSKFYTSPSFFAHWQKVGCEMEENKDSITWCCSVRLGWHSIFTTYCNAAAAGLCVCVGKRQRNKGR